MNDRYLRFGGELDEPDEPTQREAGRGAGDFVPPEKSAMVDVQIGSDRLPTGITLAPRWKSLYNAMQYGESIMSAYRYAVYELALHLAETRTKPVSDRPRLQAAAPLLLQQRSYDEYQQTWNALFGVHTYTVYGRGLNYRDEPGVTVTARTSSLLSVAVDADWVRTADEATIAADILDCCEQVRAKRPQLVHDVYLDTETDQELTVRLVRHEQQLLRNEK